MGQRVDPAEVGDALRELFDVGQEFRRGPGVQEAIDERGNRRFVVVIGIDPATVHLGLAQCLLHVRLNAGRERCRLLRRTLTLREGVIFRTAPAP